MIKRATWIYRFLRSWWHLRWAARFAANQEDLSAFPGDEHPLRNEKDKPE